MRWPVGAICASLIALTGATLSGCGAGSADPAAATDVPTTASITTPSPTTPPATTTPAPTEPPETPTSTTTTTVPVATLAPIVTYDAEIEILTPQAVAAPVALRVPSLGIEAGVEPTGVDELGELAVPNDAKTLVWYRFGPTPGAPGSAVIAGHLDWRGTLGTFNRLEDTPVGETVTVAYDDGSERAFIVRSVEIVDKPAVAVNGTFAKDGESLLRLVTCGGAYNGRNRYYQNVVVTAVPA